MRPTVSCSIHDPICWKQVVRASLEETGETSCRTNLFIHKDIKALQIERERDAGSLLAFHHDYVVAKLSLDGWIGVHWIGDGANRKGKGSVLERTDHRAANLPAQVTTRPCFVLAISRCHFGELLAGFYLLKRFENLRLLLAKDVTDFNCIATFLLFSCERNETERMGLKINIVH